MTFHSTLAFRDDTLLHRAYVEVISVTDACLNNWTHLLLNANKSSC